jgi:hypothetical protein
VGEGAGSGPADNFAKVGRPGLATAGAPARYMPAAFERIAEGEGFRAGLHLSAMIERPRGNHDRAAPGVASRGAQVPVDGALTITSGGRPSRPSSRLIPPDREAVERNGCEDEGDHDRLR